MLDDMRSFVALLCLLAAVLAGCGGGAKPSASARNAPSAAPSATPQSSTPAPATTSPGTTTSTAAGGTGAGLPRPDHVLVVMLENHSLDQVIGPSSAPFLNALAAHGALFTNFHAITHPSEPNYLALFSGSTQGVSSDACPVNFSAPNLGRALLDAGHTFVGYAEDLPQSGFAGCSSGDYARKHAPWVDFSNLPASVSQPMTAFPTDYSTLPTVSFVIPNLQHDMHDGTLAQADTWLQQHLTGYVTWAAAHNSLLVVTADENDGSAGNLIPAVIAGAHVRPGSYAQHYDLYSLLRTIEDMYALPRVGQSASAAPISGVWS